jgi:hypothetical protein
MTHDELIAKLIELGFNEGWAVRNGKIVVWENPEQVPDELAEHLELDEVTE